MGKYKPLKDLQKESLRVRFANTLASLEHRADGLDVSAEKLRESGLAQAAAWCEQAQQHLRAAHSAVAAFIADLEKE